MDNQLTALATKLTRTQGASSIADLVGRSKEKRVFLLLDCSGSMGTTMSGNGKRRIDGLRDAVAEIQRVKPTRMVAFRGMTIEAVTSVPEPDGGTPLDRAFDYCKAMGCNRIVLISDGQPGDPVRSLHAAKELGQVDVIYVGDPGDNGDLFMQDLAAATGGESFNGDLSDPLRLGRAVIGLLEAANA